MRVFLIGGTGFTGPTLVRQLLDRGHDVSFLHRGQTQDERTNGAREFIADRKVGLQLASAIAEAAPDIVVDMIPFTADDAIHTQRACKGVAKRVIALSSIDVYLAFGRIQNTEPGPLQLTPLTESSALRETNQPNGSDNDKIAVEIAYMNDADLISTILRLPAIYGARDPHRRLRGYLKRMDDGRKKILLGSTIADWKFSRGYVENVAHAIVLAVERDVAGGETYNVAEPQAMTELEFVRAIGKAAGWQGDVKVLPDSQMPKHLQHEVNFQQNWDVDSTKIRKTLGYAETVDTDEAIRRTVQWERDNPPDVEPFDYDYAEEDRAIDS
ncbi:MAG: NAD-dependent epimerase/dehydratase family protein [Pirellulaceae bacterium]|nr:NAD-dependent epimerase/dehydratase family protein [Pirellulaceae bacterium]